MFTAFEDTICIWVDEYTPPSNPPTPQKKIKKKEKTVQNKKQTLNTSEHNNVGEIPTHEVSIITF